MSIDTALMTLPLPALVERAWATGSTLDLSDAAYGRVHWGDQQEIATQPFPYYYFLAGLTRLAKAETVIEIGTHFGGSARAIANGGYDQDRIKVVTFDITSDGVRQLAGDARIAPHQLDANSEPAFKAARDGLGGVKADFVYIDTFHEFWPTFLSFAVYAEMFRPSLVVLDDITLNEEMSNVWRIVQDTYGSDNTIDVTTVVPAIRPAGEISPGKVVSPGFGLVRIPRNRGE